ncbi:KAT8 regulatory NSL complex subunit 1-like protein isoform X2 [Bombina bombina]|uniref:KAT8 regulatory NSL complex subunit 1-like protein isoform X2 n=1 Tax=Bombina bombina TaxID=8345 RepID=UPI00235AF93F|nr:KAT8 regulatory NSL complex subunit 1-like protein isoform X2 [Bombina bombina]
MTPALTETATQGHEVHFSPSLSLLGLNCETGFCTENSKPMEQGSLSKANGSSVIYADTEQCLQTELMSLKHVGSQSSAHYQTVFFLTSSAALNLQSKSNPVWKMEEQDVCRQRFHIKKDAHPLLSGVSFQPERKVKRELFPGTVSQLLADVHKLWDMTLTEAQEVDGIHIPKHIFNGAKAGEIISVACNNDHADVPNNITTKESEANSVLLRCLNQQQALLNRAKRNQMRLQALLAKHSVEHCSQQIKCFVNHQFRKMKEQNKLKRLDESHHKKCTPTNLKSISPRQPDDLCASINSKNCYTPAAIRKFTVSSRGILGHIEQELDSDATGSSSDEEWDEKSRSLAKGYAELNWLSHRARVGSRWVWLEAQISDLEYKIQQLTDLHSKIRSTKGTVMFEEPSKGIFGQESHLLDPSTLLSPAGRLLRPPEGTNLSPAKELEMSPSSPTLLLRNIEKQSARLTEMVSSLIVPVNNSPNYSFKPCGQKRVASSFPDSTTRLQKEKSHPLNGFWDQQQIKRRKKVRIKSTSVSMANTCTSARTKAVQTFYKRKLYRLYPDCPPGHLALFSYDESPHKTNHNSSRTSNDKLQRPCLMSNKICHIDHYFHPVLSLPSGLPLHIHLDALLKNRDAVDCPTLKGEVGKSPTKVPVHCSKSMPPSSTPQTRYEMRRRERTHASETEADVHSPFTLNTFRHATPSNDILTPPSAQKSSLQRAITREPSNVLYTARRRLRSESSYDIDNIVIPMSLVAPTKVEKLQYKEIITPSWKTCLMRHMHPAMKNMSRRRKPAGCFGSKTSGIKEIDLQAIALVPGQGACRLLMIVPVQVPCYRDIWTPCHPMKMLKGRLNLMRRFTKKRSRNGHGEIFHLLKHQPLP